MNNVSDIRKYFINELKAENFVTDKTGQKTIEMIGASFLANQPSIFGEPNQQYIDAEINWYNSKSTNINDIYKGSKIPPQAWQYSANGHGEINSNYGFLIYDDKFYSQWYQKKTVERENEAKEIAVGQVMSSIDTPIGEEGGRTLADVIPDTSDPLDTLLDKDKLKIIIQRGLAKLSKREEMIVRLRFGLHEDIQSSEEFQISEEK